MVSCAYELLMVCGGIEKVHVGILLAYKKPLLKWKRPLIFEKEVFRSYLFCPSSGPNIVGWHCTLVGCLGKEIIKGKVFSAGDSAYEFVV